MRFKIATITTATVLVLAACGGTNSDAETRPFTEQVQARSISRAQPLYSSFAEAMPTVSYRIGDGREVNASDLYVRGVVTDAEPGRSFTWELDDNGENEERIELDFNSSEAMISTVHLTIKPEVQITVDGAVDPEPVVVGLALEAPADPAAVADEFKAYGSVVVLLHKSPVLDYEPEAWTILEDGALLATVNDSGVLNFPAIEQDEVARLAPEPITVEQMEQAPPTLIQLTLNDQGLYVRE